jgi:hypothetical protein
LTPSSVSPRIPGLPSPDRRRGSRSRPTRRSNKSSGSPTLTSQAAGEGILGQLDFPGFNPDDALGMGLLPGSSSLSSRAVMSTSPVNYTTTHQGPASLLAYDSLGSQTYPPWPASTGYGPDLSTTSHMMPSYSATAGPDERSLMPPVFPSSSSYPGLHETQHYSTYLNTNDYANLDPRFWPPSTQPGI